MISNPFTPEIEFTQVSGITQNIEPWNSCFFDDISHNPDGPMKTRKCELIFTNPLNAFDYGVDHTNIPYFVGHKSISSVVESPPNFSWGTLNTSLVTVYLNSLLNEIKNIPYNHSGYCVTSNSEALSQNVKFANDAESLECQRLRAAVAPTSICFRFWYKYELSLGASGRDSNNEGLSCFLAVDFFPNKATTEWKTEPAYCRSPRRTPSNNGRKLRSSWTFLAPRASKFSGSAAQLAAPLPTRSVTGSTTPHWLCRVATCARRSRARSKAASAAGAEPECHESH